MRSSDAGLLGGELAFLAPDVALFACARLDQLAWHNGVWNRLCSGVVGELARAARHLEMRMLNPLFALSFEAARFGLEMQSVVALRLMRLMGGSEARRSVSEKMAAPTAARTSATTVSITNGNDPKVGKTVSNVYKKRGRANKRRLSK
jgi:hypothetical protein